MNTLFRFRFLGLLLLFSTVLFSSCKKDTVEPAAPADLAARVAGTYTYSELTTGGKTAPAAETNLKGSLTITRRTANTVDIALAITLKNGGAFLDQSLQGIEVRESGSEVQFVYDNEEFARGNGTRFTLNGYDTANKPFKLTATK